MAPIGEILSSLFGAFHLAHADPDGMRYFNASHEGFWRSFTAAILIAPLFAILLTVRYIGGEEAASVFRFSAVEAIAYVISWVAFPLLLFYLTDILSIGAKYIRYIVAYNWISVLQNVVYLPFALLVEAHLLEGSPAAFIGYILLGLVLLYTWFVTRTALEVSNFMAAGLVLVDLLISIFINTLAQGMLRLS
jgi:hypothetical protein